MVRGGFSEPVCGKVLTSPDRNARWQRVLGSERCRSKSARERPLSGPDPPVVTIDGTFVPHIFREQAKVCANRAPRPSARVLWSLCTGNCETSA